MRRSIGVRIRYGALPALGLCLLISSCSSSSDSSGGGSSSSASVGVRNATGPAVSGAAVTVGAIYTASNQTGNAPGIQQGAEAAAKYINSELGGIAGHPVSVLACNGKNAPESDTQCATQFVNSKVVDVIGLDGLWGTNGQPITEKAGIPNQTTPLSAGEYTGSGSFPFDGGTAAGAGAVATYAISQHWKSISCIYVDIASVKPACDVALANPVKAAGMDFVSVAIPPTATDFSQYAHAASVNDPDAILMLDNAASNARFVKAAQQLGVKTQYFAANITASDDYFNIGGPSNGTIFYFPTHVWTDTGNADIATFVAAMKRYAPSAPINAQTEQGFAGVMNVQRLGKTMSASDLGAAAFTKALKQVSNFNSFAGPVLNAENHLPNFPNIYLTGAYLYRYSDGSFTAVGSGLFSVPS